jgi:hypothetical protein
MSLTFALPKTSVQAEVAQLVEHNLAKVGVAGSSLVFRSKKNPFIVTMNGFFVLSVCCLLSPLPDLFFIGYL